MERVEEKKELESKPLETKPDNKELIIHTAIENESLPNTKRNQIVDFEPETDSCASPDAIFNSYCKKQTLSDSMYQELFNNQESVVSRETKGSNLQNEYTVHIDNLNQINRELAEPRHIKKAEFI